MNELWHALEVHGVKLLFLAFVLGRHIWRWRLNQIAKAEALQPPQSAPAPEPMLSQSAPVKAQAKIEGSPWTNSNDPFNS